MIIWYSGNSGAGKTSCAKKIKCKNDIHLDGDDMRLVWKLGFSKEDRWEQNIRIAKLAKLLNSQGFDIIVSTICPYKKLRNQVKKITDCDFIYLNGGEKPSVEYPYER